MIEDLQHNIFYSCVGTTKLGHEQFATDHALSCVISGEVRFLSNYGNHVAGPGTIGLFRKNQLVKATKVPAPDGTPCMSLSVFLLQESLHQYAAETRLPTAAKYTGPLLLEFSKDPFIKGYFDSLLPYMQQPGQMTKALAELKTKEAIGLLLRSGNHLKDFLFDFSEPHKIDLEGFMNKNYKYNVSLTQFAKLTGRSLATFKRDFQKIFELSPQKWLLNKRLNEAHFLIAEQKQKPSDTYIEVGFENLSHFSSSFKNFFGYNPSSIMTH